MSFEHMHKRRGFWYYIRRVPKPALALVPRAVVVKSTSIRIADDPKGIVARTKVLELDSQLSYYWADLLQGKNPAPRLAYQRNAAIAALHNLPYLENTTVENLPDDQFIERIALVRQDPRPEVASALMGTLKKPGLLLSGLVEEFERISSASLKTKSENQKKKWRVARQSNAGAFLDVIGHDIELTDIARHHVVSLRDHWNELILKDQINIASANKYIGRVAAMFKTVTEVHQLGCSDIFAKIYIKGGKDGVRAAFATDWVQNTLLAEGILDGLNREARAIVYLMVETGIRLSEACNLRRNHIILDHDIPHIKILPEGRQLKTDQSERDIPLVGVALMAMKENPTGFPRYLDKNPQASGAINKYLDTNLKLQPGQTLYSLRHTFKNRLTDVDCLDQVSARLMGHEYALPKYGEPSLETKLKWLKKIAFVPPDRI